jgi:nucleotide-binding universal stress UspA family protein
MNTAQAASQIRTVLTHVTADEAGERRLAVAADLARRLGATLMGLGAQAIPPITPDPYGLMEGSYLEAMDQAIDNQLKAARTAFERAAQSLADQGLDAEWRSAQHLPLEAVAMVSRAADLIVAGGDGPGARDRYRACDTGELVLTSGRPVLVTPPNGASFDGGGVLVAWKDTRESRRALADALPFLELAERVRLVEVCDEDEAEDVQARLDSIARALARHGVEAQAAPLAGRRAQVAGKLEAAAAEMDADLIVFGGYGHSRMGEWVFGGVTRDLLHGSGRFLLMSH